MIKNDAIKFFSNIFSGDATGSDLGIQIPFKKVLNDQGKRFLNSPISMEELEEVTLNGNQDKAQGPDGFTFGLFLCRSS